MRKRDGGREHSHVIEISVVPSARVVPRPVPFLVISATQMSCCTPVSLYPLLTHPICRARPATPLPVPCGGVIIATHNDCCPLLRCLCNNSSTRIPHSTTRRGGGT